MSDHPIPSVTEPLQYRAIGIVRAVYSPKEADNFTRGFLVDSAGEKVEAVVLGRVMSLMRRHLSLELPHLWVVYPRCRDENNLHLQITGIWEPSTLSQKNDDLNKEGKLSELLMDQLNEGDDYFSIRGELIYTRPESKDLVVKIRQRRRNKA